MRQLSAVILVSLLIALLTSRSPRGAGAQSPFYGYSGWATYYGIEDGFIRGDVMYDGTQYDPADPTIAAASFLIPLHTWLRVCSPAQCIVVQVRDRGLLDQNSILLDLSRAAYGLLFGGLGGKQWVSAYFSDPGTLTIQPYPIVTSPLAAAPPAASVLASPVAVATSSPAPTAALPTAQPAPAPSATPSPVPNSIHLPGR